MFLFQSLYREHALSNSSVATSMLTGEQRFNPSTGNTPLATAMDAADMDGATGFNPSTGNTPLATMEFWQEAEAYLWFQSLYREHALSNNRFGSRGDPSLTLFQSLYREHALSNA